MTLEQAIAQSYAEGLSYRQCAKRHGVSKKRVENIIVGLGIARPAARRRTDINWELAVSLRKAGYGVRAIVKRTGGNPSTVRNGIVNRGGWVVFGSWPNAGKRNFYSPSRWSGYFDAEIASFGRLEHEHNSWWSVQTTSRKERALARYYANHEINKKRAAETQKRHYHAKWKNDPQRKVAQALRSASRRIARKINVRAKEIRNEKLLGCTYFEARAHIEAQFKPGWTWLNHGTVWEIDHIRPLVSFDLTDPEQRRLAGHYTNLRPLEKAENRRLGIIARDRKRHAA